MSRKNKKQKVEKTPEEQQQLQEANEARRQEQMARNRQEAEKKNAEKAWAKEHNQATDVRMTALHKYAHARKEDLTSYIGTSVKTLPTPSCILNRQKMQVNCDAMLQRAKKLNAHFRPHFKTHKTIEGLRMQLGQVDEEVEDHGRVVVSSIMEIYQLLPLVKEGLITSIVYGVPLTPGKLSTLHKLRFKIPKLILMVDSIEQVKAIERYASQSEESGGRPCNGWWVFIKLDCGYGRAGLRVESPEFEQILDHILVESDVFCMTIYGFYTHSGQSYHSTSLQSAREILLNEIDICKKALDMVIPYHAHEAEYVLSIGATPTALAFEDITLPTKHPGEFELHAGCYAICDLQQHATSLVKYEDIAIRVLAEVATYYEHRDEVLIDAGCLALSRETGPIDGYGLVAAPNDAWRVGRISQEHGILTRIKEGDAPKTGDAVLIVPQHACITGAGHQWYYVVDEDGLDAKVVDIWIRFNGW